MHRRGDNWTAGFARWMKSLVNPLFWYLLLQAVGLIVLMRRKGGRIAGWLLVLTLVLAAASTPWARYGLEAGLQVPTLKDPAQTPAYIFVLGGGFFSGATPAADILTTDSQRRVMHGAALWQRYPSARLVLSGTEATYAGIRAPERLGELMADIARSQGVPQSAILLEPRSHNTLEHPVEALRLSGVNAEQPIAIVTSGWHMRRAQREFCRHFTQVMVNPLPAMPRPTGWQSFLPDAAVLNANTTLVREWVGMLWYTLRNVAGPASKC